MIPEGVIHIVYQISMGGVVGGPAAWLGYVGRRSDGQYVAWNMYVPHRFTIGDTTEQALAALILREHGTFIDKPVDNARYIKQSKED